MAYLVEHFLVHIIDFVIVGAGYYMVRFGRWRAAGMVLLSFYVLALVGTLMPEGVTSYWPFINAALGVVVAEIAGWMFRQRASRQTT